MTDYIALARECGAQMVSVSPDPNALPAWLMCADEIEAFAARIAQAAPEDAQSRLAPHAPAAQPLTPATSEQQHANGGDVSTPEFFIGWWAAEAFHGIAPPAQQEGK